MKTGRVEELVKEINVLCRAKNYTNYEVAAAMGITMMSTAHGSVIAEMIDRFDVRRKKEKSK